MAKGKPRTERDEITMARSVFDEIVESTEHEETPKEKRARKGGTERAAKLPAKRRSAIAKKAAAARWKKRS